MEVNKFTSAISNRVPSRLGVAGVVVLVALSAVAADAGLWKLLGISWAAFVAMGAAIPFGARAATQRHARTLVWGYGLASGAMITSAGVFLLPEAIEHHPAFGGFGVAFGILVGFATHTLGHQLTHREGFDHTAVELAAHSFADGAIVGLVYASHPGLGALFGLAVVSHKAPAGYAAARRLASEGGSVSVLLLPASGMGITAILGGLLDPPSSEVVNALILGFASGIFLHLAMDFLPRCELGSEAYEVAHESDNAHALLDRLRVHAVASTALGGLAVLAGWVAVAA